MNRFFDSLYDQLSVHWKKPHAPRGKRAFRCVCERPVFFRNSECLACHAPLGYEAELGEVLALEPVAELEGSWRLAGEGRTDKHYHRCSNFESPAGCNWLVPADDGAEFCLACRLNRTIPDLSDADNRKYWREVEVAKRRLVAQLLELGLPVEPKSSEPDRGLEFDLLSSTTTGPKVMTGHAGGLITINVEEADDAKREAIRAALHEPYRTLLGHFRHEIGHYYWDRLVRDTEWHEPFRGLFGDERADYGEAIKANYDNGPPADWPQRYISAYAASHPWEDWAETWAHYLLIGDSLETALALGFDAEDLELDVEPFAREDLYQPDHLDAERTLVMINSWVEMVTVLNEMARSLGLPDFYPFVMSRPVVKKIHFVHLVVTDFREPGQNETVAVQQ